MVEFVKVNTERLSGKQVDALTNAYLDVCASNRFLNGTGPIDKSEWDEIANATTLTKVDLEEAFPWLLEDGEG